MRTETGTTQAAPGSVGHGSFGEWSCRGRGLGDGSQDDIRREDSRQKNWGPQGDPDHTTLLLRVSATGCVPRRTGSDLGGPISFCRTEDGGVPTSSLDPCPHDPPTGQGPGVPLPSRVFLS